MIWQSGPPRTGRHSSATSIAIPNPRRQPHEASNPRLASRDQQWRRHPGRHLPGPVERAFYRWHPQRPFFVLRFAVVEPKEHQRDSITGRLYCSPRALWKLNWFLREFGYDQDLLGRDEVDEKALVGLRGILRVSRTTLNGHCFPNLEGFASAGEWGDPSLPPPTTEEANHDL